MSTHFIDIEIKGLFTILMGQIIYKKYLGLHTTKNVNSLVIVLFTTPPRLQNTCSIPDAQSHHHQGATPMWSTFFKDKKQTDPD